ncbi:MAG: MurT ligase domain-containing protein [Bacillota bacterium]
MSLTRALGRGGTTLPGRLALILAPQILTELSSRLKEGILVITGTNGKTTTTALINNILKEHRINCIHNQSGSNLSWGVASALIEYASWLGKLNQDCAVIEVDEGSFPGVVSNISPRGVTLTNIFRDQLDRFGEIDHIQNSLKEGLEKLPPGSFKAINADDPSLVEIKNDKQKNTVYYGLELDLPSYPFQNSGRDIKTCPLCSKVLKYNKIYFAHLGHFYCPECHYKRPEPAIKLTGCQFTPGNSTQLEISMPHNNITASVSLLGIYNLYNILAAVACAHGLGIPGDIIVKALKKTTPSFGRMEQFALGDKNITMTLIKNPVGTNEVLRTILTREGKINLLIAINDKIADGTDVSWLWDVDFEQLLDHRNKFANIIVSGTRAWEMAVRLKYTGFTPEIIMVEEKLQDAISLALEKSDSESRLFILPNYTAMLEMRRDLNRMGLGQPYWNQEEKYENY